MQKIQAELEKLIDAHVARRDTETQRQYASILREWQEHLKKPWHKATDLDVIRFAKAQNERRSQYGPLSKATIRRKLGVLNKIYQRLQAAGLVQRNPFYAELEEWRSYRTGSRRPTQIIPFEQVLELIAAQSPHTVRGLRDRALLGGLLGGALRVGEAAKLTLDDVVVEDDGVTLRLRDTKNGEDYLQRIAPDFADHIIRWLQVRREMGAKPTDPFLPRLRKSGEVYPGHILKRQLNRIFQECCEQAGIIKHVTPHSARKTAISKLLNDGVPLREVRKFARHKSERTTEMHYDALRDDGAEKVAELLTFSKK